MFFLKEGINRINQAEYEALEGVINLMTDLRQVRVVQRALNGVKLKNELAKDVAPIDLRIIASLYHEVADLEAEYLGTHSWKGEMEHMMTIPSLQATDLMTNLLLTIDQLLMKRIMLKLETKPIDSANLGIREMLANV